MENQHREIKGYRELSPEEIKLMNEVKDLGPLIEAVVVKLQAMPDLDQRWVAMGKTNLQTGLMFLTRGITKPTFF
jgi:hypothetical protein